MSKKHNLFKSRTRMADAHTVILHHTGGGTLRGAEDTLVKKGLGYHYMIDKDGTIIEYVPPDRYCSHSFRNNTGTVGVSFVGGGKYGPMSGIQLESIVYLMRLLKVNSGITHFTGHKHVDPRWEGEPPNGIDWDVDRVKMEYLELRTGLKAKFKDSVKGKY